MVSLSDFGTCVYPIPLPFVSPSLIASFLFRIVDDSQLAEESSNLLCCRHYADGDERIAPVLAVFGSN